MKQKKTLNKNIRISVIIIQLIFFNSILNAQMPEWAMIKDREGNKYYIDKSGKIYTDDSSIPEYKAISKDGLEYYTSKVKSLWKSGSRKQSLTVAKSIMALKESSMNVINAKKDISTFLRTMQAKEGNRFIDINRDAWLYLTKEESTMYVFNDKIPFIVQCRGNAEVLAVQSVDSLQHASTMVRTGLRFTQTNGFDAIMTIVAERFADTIESVNVLQQYWNTIAFDTFERTLLQYSDTMLVYSFVTKDTYSLVGVELLLVKDNRGYCVRIFSTKEKYEQHKDDIQAILQSFSTP